MFDVNQKSYIRAAFTYEPFLYEQKLYRHHTHLAARDSIVQFYNMKSLIVNVGTTLRALTNSRLTRAYEAFSFLLPILSPVYHIAKTPLDAKLVSEGVGFFHALCHSKCESICP